MSRFITVPIKFLPFHLCTTRTCIMQFTETSVSVKSINFIVPTYILKGAAPTSFSTRCKRVSRRIKRDKLLPRFPHFCYFIEQKSISQTQPYPVSFPVSNFFLFLPFLFFSLPFFFFSFYPPRSQQRGVVGEGRSGKIKRGEKSKRERERKSFSFSTILRERGKG